MNTENILRRLWPIVWNALKKGFEAWFFVAKLSVPAMVITRLLIYFDLMDPVALVFKPFMSLMGLPPEAALVWVSGMVANLYAAIAVLFSLLPVMGGISHSQLTIITCLCLVAHNMLVEGQVCRGAGLSFWRVTVFRIFMAMAFGIIINLASLATGWGTGPASLPDFIPDNPLPTWPVWFMSSIEQLFLILLVVEALMLLIEFVKQSGLTRLISKVLGPPLRFAGVGENAVMVTVIGCVLGLAYGGGLIVAESRSGYIANRDIFAALILMTLLHSILEDTLIMWALGGSLWWILPGRIVFALLVAAVINRLALKKRWKPLLVGKQLEFETV